MTRDRFLLLTQDPGLVAACGQALRDRTTEVVEVRDVGRLHELLDRGAALVLVDVNLPDLSLQSIADELAEHRDLPVIVLAGGSTAAWDRLSRGSPLEQVVDTPVDGERLSATVKDLLDRSRFLHEQLVGRSAAIQTLREQILLIGPTPVTVLITGESGVGKDVVARALHQYNGPEAPYKPINCAAIPENLLENELFGHERGAFTDARAQTRGIFEQANGGTVFLDEIGEMALSAQVRLLRVLEERQVTRIGGDQPIDVDVRVLAASNKDLLSSVDRGEFRRDLYYRLKVVELHLPPLRERRQDIPLLFDHFVESYGRDHTRARFGGFTRAAMDLLTQYDWPGNVRELRNLVENLVFLGPPGQVDVDDLVPLLKGAPSLGHQLPVATNKTPDQSERELIYFALLDLKREVADLRRLMVEGGDPTGNRPFARPVYPVDESTMAVIGDDGDDDNGVLPSLKDLEREAIARALEQVDNNRRKAAELLGIGERTLYRKLDKYGFR